MAKLMRRYLTAEEQPRLLAAAKGEADPLAQRDYHWMAALILTGMRIEEFSLLRVPQVALALRAGWLVSNAQACKGGRANEFRVTAQLRFHLEALMRYAALLGGDAPVPAEGLPLVPGRHGVPLTVRSYQQRIKLWAAKAGLDTSISPHWLRHTRAMNIIRSSRATSPGMALRVCQAALGHSSIKTTSVYLRLSREELAAELDRVDGPARMNRKQARAWAENMGVA